MSYVLKCPRCGAGEESITVLSEHQQFDLELFDDPEQDPVWLEITVGEAQCRCGFHNSLAAFGA